jgi:1-acyl-sn-glycerol-3-phosphate acyltransferase
LEVQNILKGLNPEQKKAVLHNHETHSQLLILAGAGSGKTSVLTKRIQYRIAMGAKPSSILALTFTAKAAFEMKERVCALFPDAEVRLSTFHSLALFLLRENMDGIFGYERLGFLKAPKPVHSDAQDFACELVKEGLKASDLEREDLFSLDLKPRIEKRLKMIREKVYRSGDLVFEDMIYLAIRLLEQDAEFRALVHGRWSEFLVDEYQDINPSQYRLVRALLGNRKSLFVVGDDDQAIYGFRGADIGNIIRFQKDFKESALIRLEWNYRSVPSILHLANRIFTNKALSLRKVLRAGNTRQDPLFKENRSPVLWEIDNPIQEMQMIVQKIKEMRLDYALEFYDFAILVRYNHQRLYYEQALKEYEIPFYQITDDSIEIKGVHIETVHSSKGLQYPVVFYAGLAENLTPGLCKGSRKKQKNQLKEERRLFYVGVTRAEAVLFLLYCKKRHWKGQLKHFQKSRFLKCMPRRLPESSMPLFLFRILVVSRIIFFMGVHLFVLPYQFLFARKHIKTWLDYKIQTFSAYCIRLLRIQLRVENQSNLAKIDWNRPVVILANHQSYADIPIAFLSVERTVGFIAKKELKAIPFLGFWMKQIGCFFIDRNKKGAGLHLQEKISKNKGVPKVFIFPEGTRSTDAKLLPFKSGGFRIANDLDATILPIVIHKSREAWESRQNTKPVFVSVEILEPTDLLELKRDKPELGIRDFLMPKIRSQMEGLL